MYDPTAGRDLDRVRPSFACANCGDARLGRFCARCGQNDRHYARGMGSVAWEFAREAFEVDSRLLQTLKLLLFRPGALATEFSRNRRARYMSPIRLYLFTSFLFVLVLSLAMPDSLTEGAAIVGQEPAPPVQAGDVAAGAAQEPSSVRSSLSDAQLEALGAVLGPTQRRRLDDVLGRPDDDGSRRVAISVVGWLADREEPEGTGLLGRMVLTSAVDLLHDPDVYVQRVIGNLPIAMFFLLPFLALGLSLCYRRRRFFVEHLVFGMHNQTFIFLCLAAALLTPSTPVGDWFRIFFLCIPQLYYLFALRRYYREGWVRTLVKGFTVWWLYTAVLLPGLVLVLFLTA